jgi:hypothetical protein
MNPNIEITREQLVTFLNEDLAREYQAILAYQEREHLTDLADALGIDNPTIEG